MARVYFWMYVIVQPYTLHGPTGYILHKSDIRYNNISECTAAALEWLESADPNTTDFDMEPVLVIDSFEQG